MFTRLFPVSVCLLLVSLSAPFVYARPYPGSLIQRQNVPAPLKVSEYRSTLKKIAPTISNEVLERALSSVICARRKGAIAPTPIQTLAVIDYSKPSTERRFWLFDLTRRALLIHDFVAHGKNSGETLPTWFSNEPGSQATSLGLYQAGDTYYGEHGLSLRLHGLESEFNDNAYERAIVIHGASYVSKSHINHFQRLGRSWGCPALSEQANHKAIQALKDGGLVFAYGNDRRWLEESPFLEC